MTKKVDLIVQARMGSKRLPGKTIANIAGKPLLYRILERLKRVKNVNEIILVIPSSKDNKILKNIGLENGVKVFSGSEDDLLDRFFKAASFYNSEIIVRFPADNLTPEPNEIDKIIFSHLNFKKNCFSSNICEIRGSGYPDGIGAEVFSYNLLKEVWEKNHSEELREHVHLNFYNYNTGFGVDEEWCSINTIQCPKEFSRPDLVLDVNTKAQLIFMQELYEYLYPRNPKFHITDIIKWYDNIYKINN